MFNKAAAAVCGALFLLSACVAHADTIMFKQGVSQGGTYTGAEDTYLHQGGSQTQNFGGKNNLDIGRAGNETRRALYRFDVSSLDGEFSSVESITLRLFLLDTPNGVRSPGRTYTLHRPNAANADWIEGTNTAAQQNGSSSWSHKIWNSVVANQIAWDGGAGMGSLGYDPALASATVLATHAGSFIDFVIGDPAVATNIINEWVNGTNGGFMLRETLESGGADSRIQAWTSEQEISALRPELIIDYTAIPEPGTFGLCGVALLAGCGFIRRSRPRMAD